MSELSPRQRDVMDWMSGRPAGTWVTRRQVAIGISSAERPTGTLLAKLVEAGLLRVRRDDRAGSFVEREFALATKRRGAR